MNISAIKDRGNSLRKEIFHRLSKLGLVKILYKSFETTAGREKSLACLIADLVLIQYFAKQKPFEPLLKELNLLKKIHYATHFFGHTSALIDSGAQLGDINNQIKNEQPLLISTSTINNLYIKRRRLIIGLIEKFLTTLASYIDTMTLLHKCDVLHLELWGNISNSLISFRVGSVYPFQYRPLDAVTHTPKSLPILLASSIKLGYSIYTIISPFSKEEERKANREEELKLDNLLNLAGCIGRIGLILFSKEEYLLVYKIGCCVARHLAHTSYLIKEKKS
jgi:hypothetical protein